MVVDKTKGEIKMFQLYIITTDKKAIYSHYFHSEWAAGMVAIGYIRQYPEIQTVYVLNRETGEIVNSYEKGF